VNAAGEVIGMDTAASNGTTFSSASNIGFAIPINTAVSIADQIAAGHASATIHIGLPAFLGVQIQSTGAGSASGGAFGGFGGSTTPATNGAVIAAVPSGTPARSAGLAAGDTIVAIDGKTISTPADLSAAISAHRPGDTVKVSWVDQAGQRHSASVRLATGPAD
jgi:S1-C subfamily serine protease